MKFTKKRGGRLFLPSRADSMPDSFPDSFPETGLASALPLPLDNGLASYFAFSLRDLGTGVAGGNVVQWYSANLSTSMDFTEADLLDGTAQDWANSGDGEATLDTWYDQSGNARHFDSAAVGTAPKVCTGGVIVTENGLPAMLFDGTDDYLKRLSGATESPNDLKNGAKHFMGQFVYQCDSSGGNDQYILHGYSAFASEISFKPRSTTTSSWGSCAWEFGRTFRDPAPAFNTSHVAQFGTNGSKIDSLWYDGALGGTGFNTSGNYATAVALEFGRKSGGGELFKGTLQEVVWFEDEVWSLVGSLSSEAMSYYGI